MAVQYRATRAALRLGPPWTWRRVRRAHKPGSGRSRALRSVATPARSLAAGVLVLGLAASILGALQWRSYITGQQDRQVATTTETARASLTGAIQRDEDLIATLGGLVASGAPMSNAELGRLYRHVPAMRDAGVVSVQYIERVPAGSLGAFEAQVRADPPAGVAVSAAALAAEGPRVDYCLTRDAVVSPSGTRDLTPAEQTAERAALVNQLDYCTGSTASVFARTEVTGAQAVTDLRPSLDRALHTSSADRLFDLVLPIYAPRAPLGSSGERADALLGWVDGVFCTVPILQPVVGGTSGVTVTLSYAGRSGPFLVASAGPRRSGATEHTVAVGPEGRWRAAISVVPNASATVQGVGVLADLVVIVLLVALIVVLFRSRRRAFEAIERKNAELQHRALHDSLTGLPNRDLVVQRAKDFLERAERDARGVAAFVIDLDSFNGVNDTYGHRAGDEVLSSVADRLADTLGPEDTLGRMAGDEFVVLASGDSLAAGPEVLAERLLAQLSSPFELSCVPAPVALVRLGATIGVATGSGQSAEDLLRNAHIALSDAKRAGRHRFAVFDPTMHAAARTRLAVSGELRSALDEEQFLLLYQPVFRLAGTRPIGVEALLRWRHPMRGVLAPAEFVPLLEESGLIVEVGREVLRLACDQAASWAARGLPMAMSVNVSAIQLESDQFCTEVARVVASSGIDPDRLILEITESALMRDVPGTVRRLQNLKALGIRLAIDDFGTGYSSLAYLGQFPVDILKIDRAFVSAMTGSRGGLALMRTMLELARALNLETVAEGIEEPLELRVLTAERCRFGQGYLLAKPLDASQIELFFDNARPLAMAAAFAPS